MCKCGRERGKNGIKGTRKKGNVPFYDSKERKGQCVRHTSCREDILLEVNRKLANSQQNISTRFWIVTELQKLL